MSRLIKIIDLDGCISDDRWRRQLIAPAPAAGRATDAWGDRFHLYHASAWKDEPTNLHELAVLQYEYVVFTGRPLRYANDTRQWLREKARILPLAILHRNNDDHRPSHEVKSTQMDWLLAANHDYGVRREDIVEAIDDVAEVVGMYIARWRIPARIVRIGDEEHGNG